MIKNSYSRTKGAHGCCVLFYICPIRGPQKQEARARLAREVVRELAGLGSLHALPARVEPAPQQPGGRDPVVGERAGGAAEAAALHEEGAGL